MPVSKGREGRFSGHPYNSTIPISSLSSEWTISDLLASMISAIWLVVLLPVLSNRIFGGNPRETWRFTKSSSCVRIVKFPCFAKSQITTSCAGWPSPELSTWRIISNSSARYFPNRHYGLHPVTTSSQAAMIFVMSSRFAANCKAASRSSFTRFGKSAMISSYDIPAPSHYRISTTAMRVPAMHGFPNRMFGSIEIRSR
jgi:hypothetical protein